MSIIPQFKKKDSKMRQIENTEQNGRPKSTMDNYIKCELIKHSNQKAGIFYTRLKSINKI